MTAFYDFYHYDVEIVLGGMIITTDLADKEYGLCDILQITGTCNNPRTATFTFIPPEETQLLESYQGRTVNITFRKANGQFKQVFSGVVDTSYLDFTLRKITLTCSDGREQKILNLDPDQIKSIGIYSPYVLGGFKNNDEELAARLQTLTADFDFDSQGLPQLTSWTPKLTPDFTLLPGDVFRLTNPTIVNTNRTKTLNTVSIQTTFTFQRLHQQCCSFVWPGYGNFLSDWFTADKPSFPGKDTISAAATGVDWKLVVQGTSINFVDLWAEQTFLYGSGFVHWQPNDVQKETIGKTKFMGYVKDSTGNFVTVGSPARLVPQYEPVLDAAGNQVMEVVKTTVIDTSSHLCRGASWVSALRFAQNITEQYTTTVYAPVSIAYNNGNTVDSFSNINITDNFDSTPWEKSDVVSVTTQNFYIDQKATYPSLGTALQVSYLKAKKEILAAHRDVVVSFQTTYPYPDIDLVNTVDVLIDESVLGATSKIHAIGKVDAISHTIDFKSETARTTISLRLSRSQGVVSDTTYHINPIVQNPSYIGATPPTIVLETHLGEDMANTIGSDKWTGWIGNKVINSGLSSARSQYLEQFIVDFPAINPDLRKEKVYSAANNFVINIPNDFLDVST